MSTKLSAKILAMILSLSMLLTFMPSVAFAGTEGNAAEDVTVMDDSSPDNDADLQSNQENAGNGEQPNAVNNGENGGSGENPDFPSDQEDTGLLAVPNDIAKGGSDTGEGEGEKEPSRAAGDPVAKIDGTDSTYTSIAGAVEAAIGGDTIILLQDCTVDSTITYNKNLTFDLNGHTATATGTMLKVTGGTTTVTDSSGTKSGKLSAKTVIDLTPPENKGSAFVLQAGVIESSSTDGSPAIRGYANEIWNSFSITINGGDVIAKGSSHAVHLERSAGKMDSALTVNGGTLTSENGHTVTTKHGHIVVNGGSIIATGSGADALHEEDMGQSKFEIKGGAISSEHATGIYIRSQASSSSDPAFGSHLYVTGGTISGVTSLNVSFSIDGLSISGGSFEGKVNLGKGNSNSITGGVFDTTLDPAYIKTGYVQDVNGVKGEKGEVIEDYLTVTIDPATAAYAGKDLRNGIITVTATDAAGNDVTADTTFAWTRDGKATEEVMDAGSYVATGTHNGKSDTAELTVTGTSFNEFDVRVEDTTFTGYPGVPRVIAKVDGKDKELVPGRDFTVSYPQYPQGEVPRQGPVRARITGINSFSGTIENAQFNIKSTNLSDVTWTLDPEECWLTEAGTCKPKVTGTIKSLSGTGVEQTYTLTEGKEFNVSYSDNTDYGTGKVTITWADNSNFTGDPVVKEFLIAHYAASLTHEGETTYYKTLPEAVAASNSGDTVKLLEDVKLDETLSIGGDRTLDLDTFSITPADGFTTSAAHPLLRMLASGKPVTIKGNGGVIRTGNECAIYMFQAHLVLEEGVTVQAARQAIDLGSYSGYSSGTRLYVRGATITAKASTIYSYSGQNEQTYIESGKVIAENANDGYIFYTHSSYLKVTGGEIYSGNDGPILKTGNADNLIHIRGGWFNRRVDTQYIDTDEGYVQYADGYVAKYAIRLTLDPTSRSFNNQDHYPVKKVLLPDNTDVTDQTTFVWTNSDGVVVTAPKETGVYTLTATYGEYSAEATYTVTPSVARIGNAYYTSLNDAIAAASAGDTIVMIGDTTESINSVRKAVTLDLAGHSVTANGGMVVRGGKLTLKDSSENATGTLNLEGYYPLDVTDAGQFVMESGTLNGSDVHAVHLSDGSATINGGRIVGTGSSIAVAAYPGSTLTINGGEISNLHSCGVYAANSTLTITGGQISGKDGQDTHGAVWLQGNATANISGGTISGESYGVTTNGTSKAIITGGTISGTVYGAYAKAGIITVNNSQSGDGPFISGIGNGKSVGISDGTFIINGGYYKDKAGNGDGFTRPKGKYLATSTDKPGYNELADAMAMIAETGEVYPSLDAARDATTSENKTVKLITDVTLTGLWDAFSTSGKTFTFDLNGHTLRARSIGAVSVTTGSTLTIQDSSADGSGRIECSNIDAAATVNVGGWLILESGTIEYTGNNTLGAGISFLKNDSPYYSSAGITINGGTVIGKESGVEFYYGSGGFTINGGVIKGETTSLVNITGQKVTINGGYFSDDAGNDDGRFTLPAEHKLVSSATKPGYYELAHVVARIGNVYYKSLADAISAASEEDVIVMVANTETENISINKKLTVDLAGYTVTVPGTMSISAAATIKDTSTENTGVLKFPTDNADYAIDLRSGSLTLDSGKVDIWTETGIRQRGNTTVNINAGGKLVSAGEGAAIDMYGMANQERRVYVYGEIDAQGDAIINNYMAYVYAGGKVTSANGTAITAQGGSSRAIVQANSGDKIAYIEGKTGILAKGSGPSEVNGGVIIGRDASVINQGSGSFKISGGVFSDDAGNADGFTRPGGKRLIKGMDTDYPEYYALTSAVAQNSNTKVIYDTIQEAVNAAVAGQTIKLIVDCEEQFTVDKSITLDLDGKTLSYNGSVTSGPHITVDGTDTALTLTGDGEIASKAQCGIKVNSGASLTIDGVSLTSDHAGIVAEGTGMVALAKGEINATGTMAGAELHDQAGFTMNGGSITSSKGDGIAADGSATVSITDGTIESGKYAVNTTEASAAQIDGGSFKGTTASVNNTGTGTFAINGGKFSDDAGNGDSFTCRPEGNVLFDWDGDEWYTLGIPVAKRVVDGRDVLYTSLQDAVDASEDENDVVYMIRDVALSKALQIKGKKVTLNIGNHTLSDAEDFDHSSGYGQLINVTCTITVLDRQNAALTLTGGADGKVQHSGKYAIYLAGGSSQSPRNASLTVDIVTVSATSTAIRGGNYCHVTVNSGTVLSTQDAAETVKGAIYAGSGTVTVNGGTVKNENGAAVSTIVNGDAYINGGSLEGSTYGIYSGSTGRHGVEVNDGVIIGGETSVYRGAGDFKINGGVFSDDEGNKDGYTRKDGLKLVKGINTAYPSYYALGVDKSKLRALLEASPKPNDVAVSTDGTDVEAGHKWATEEDKAAYEQAYGAAQAALNGTSATQSEVNTATENLGAALAKIKTAEVDKTALVEALQNAVMPDKVAKSADGKDVPNGGIWAVVNDQDHIDHWTTYAIAVNNAINVALNGDTQAAVNQALEDLIDAEKLLKTASVNKDALGPAIDAAQEAEEGIATSADGKDLKPRTEYTTEAERQALDDAIEAAQAVLANEKATQNDVDAAVTAVSTAKSTYEGAIKTAETNKSGLETAIGAAEAAEKDIATSADGKELKPGTEYTTAAEKKALDDAIDAAQAVLDNNEATQNAIDAAETAINAATKTYEKAIKTAITDKTSLKSAVADAKDAKFGVEVSADGKDLKPGTEYTTAAERRELDDAISAAQAVINDDEATQNRVDAEVTKINAATKTYEKAIKTVPPTNKTALEAAIEDAQKEAEKGIITNENEGKDLKPGTEYTTAAEKKAHDDAIDAAQEVLNDAEATQNDVEAAVTAINGATETYKAAVKKATTDKTDLNDAITAAQNAESDVAVSKDGSDVAKDKKWTTSEEKKALEDAIAAAQDVYNKADATQADTDAAAQAVKDATETYNAAKKSGTKPDPVPAPSAEQPVLVAKGIASGKKALNISWNNVGADRYIIYMCKCNTKNKKYSYKKIKTVNGSTFKYKKGKLAKKTYYKFYVVAQKNVNGSYRTIATSLVGHSITGNVRGKYTNPKTLKLNKSAISLSTGGSATIKGTVTKAKKGKKFSTGHAQKLRYISSNPKVASVSASGKVTANSPGSCTIYVQTINGIWKTCKVTVN